MPTIYNNSINPQTIFSDIQLIRQNVPLVHNITNFVAMPTIANMLLALGASPLMAHAAEELSDILKLSQALVINIGTIDKHWLSSMFLAQNFAHQKSIPIILDPVGAGASTFRTQSALSLLDNGISVLRGNASEIMALANQQVITKGVDSTQDSCDARQAAAYLAKKYLCVVVATGATDIIATPQHEYQIHKPHFSLITKLTAIGCSASAIIGAFAAINKDYGSAAVHAMCTLGVASEQAMQDAKGPGTFYNQLLDSLYNLTENLFSEQLTIVNKQQKTNVTEILLNSSRFSQNHSIAQKITQHNSCHRDYSLYLVADCNLIPPDKLPQFIAKVATRGISCVQLRAKNLSPKKLLATGKKLLTILKPLGIPLIINDSIAIAKQLDADGVHLGQQDATIAEARQQLGPNKIIGLSIENIAQANRAATLNVDYFGVGPLFTTTTKHDAAPPITLAELKTIKSILGTKPLVAIGGINAANAPAILACNVDGIAVASAILSAKNPIAATTKLRSCINSSSPKTLRSLSAATTPPYSCVLSIAGSDSSGGAGIQADIKTISATGGYAASVITALTAQNTLGVSSIHNIPTDFVGKQLDSVFKDINFSAVKIGMLHRPDIIEIVATKLKQWQAKKIVLDPVMVAKSGDTLITKPAIIALKKYLFPIIYLLTPNLNETEILVQHAINSKLQMEQAAKELGSKYHINVIVKGGHFSSDYCDDVLFCSATQTLHWFSAPRIISNNTHGTGCTFSAAIASYLAQNYSLLDAISKAKYYLTNAIQVGSRYAIGHGHGPVHHFANFQQTT